MPVFDVIAKMIKSEEPFAVATVLEGDRAGAKLVATPDGSHWGDDFEPAARERLIEQMLEKLASSQTGIESIELADGKPAEVFIESLLPPRRLVVVGAVHTAIPLVSFARELGYHTTVIDARSMFATRERFPHADELIEDWPDEALSKLNLGPQTDIVLLAHDPKFEDPAMRVALKSRAGYIGAMGSKRTSAVRNDRLRAEGFSEREIERIHGPIGINIGARQPGEIAISILAEILAVRSGRDPRKPGAGLQPAKADQT